MESQEKRNHSFLDGLMEATKLWHNNKFDETLAALVELSEKYQEFKGFCLLHISQALCKLERYKEAISTIVDAVEIHNAWIEDNHFDAEEFKPILNNATFIEMRQKIKAILEEKSQGKKMHYYTHYECEKANIDKVAVIVHGNHFLNPNAASRQFVEEKVNKYKNNFDKTTMIVYLFSSKIGLFGFPYWYDFKVGATEVRDMIIDISRTYSLPLDNFTLYGHSAGSGVIIEGLVHNILDPNNICLLAPYLPNLQNQIGKLIKMEDKKFFIYSGTKDFCLKYAKELNKMLDETPILHELFVEEDQDHVFSKGVELLFERSIQFLKI